MLERVDDMLEMSIFLSHFWKYVFNLLEVNPFPLIERPISLHTSRIGKKVLRLNHWLQIKMSVAMLLIANVNLNEMSQQCSKLCFLRVSAVTGFSYVTFHRCFFVHVLLRIMFFFAVYSLRFNAPCYFYWYYNISCSVWCTVCILYSWCLYICYFTCIDNVNSVLFY